MSEQSPMPGERDADGVLLSLKAATAGMTRQDVISWIGRQMLARQDAQTPPRTPEQIAKFARFNQTRDPIKL